nr:hypothetical protein [Candidatus Cloacimonadota bacterium]
MCGRFAQVIKHDELQRLVKELHAEIQSEQMPISYNVAPTHTVMAIVSNSEKRYDGYFRWGLVPSWMRELPTSPMINVRRESIGTKPSFKASFIRRRALIPANGFYEWKAPGKIPYYVYPSDGGLLYLGAIYDVWQGADGSYLPTIAIITTEANRMMQSLHHRMPVCIMAEAIDDWLDPALQDVHEAEKLMIPIPDDYLSSHRVSPLVNKVSNNFPELIAKVDFQDEI